MAMLCARRAAPFLRGSALAPRRTLLEHVPLRPDDYTQRRKKVRRRVLRKKQVLTQRHLRDPADMVVEEAGPEAEDISWGEAAKPRAARAKPAPRKSLDETLASLMNEGPAPEREEGFLADAILRKVTKDGFELTDAHVAQLVTHCIACKTKAHGALTLRMFEDVVDEAQELLATAERLGHDVGAESMCVFICVLANPTQGSARDLEKAVELLEQHFAAEEEDGGERDGPRSLGHAHAPAWVYESVLRGAAMDDDEDVATQVLLELGAKQHVSADGWAYALSSCNQTATAKSLVRVMEKEGLALGTEHYTALLKVCAKAKAFGYAETVVTEMEEKGVPLSADTYAAWMAVKASAGDADGAKRVYHRLLTELDGGDVTAALITSLLHLCLVHAKTVGDVYAQLARELFDGSLRVGLHCDHALATKALWVFTTVGDEEYAKRVADVTRGSSIEGHHFALLKEARQKSGNLREAMFMDEAELDKRGVPYEVTPYSSRKGYALMAAKVREHGRGRRMPMGFVDVSNLAMKPVPTTPKGM
eukprot:TRINITY_DN30396_c0_g1_i1.p1 TRINITY_DN30396_c0_g1~~TRINITY_DN30396_c0_g1_i1.p1  ORF type:complete len:535 (+),score=185.02 TRINITY_DN30396_c0_g1_i1:66-1670(+)